MSPRGGKRNGSGRKPRPDPKSKGVWLGQITDEQRYFIMQWLSPDERFSVLMAAANKACNGRATPSAKSKGLAKNARR